VLPVFFSPNPGTFLIQTDFNLAINFQSTKFRPYLTYTTTIHVYGTRTRIRSVNIFINISCTTRMYVVHLYAADTLRAFAVAVYVRARGRDFFDSNPSRWYYCTFILCSGVYSDVCRLRRLLCYYYIVLVFDYYCNYNRTVYTTHSLVSCPCNVKYCTTVKKKTTLRALPGADPL
jgi:hypothetical protein